MEVSRSRELLPNIKPLFSYNGSVEMEVSRSRELLHDITEFNVARVLSRRNGSVPIKGIVTHPIPMPANIQGE